MSVNQTNDEKTQSKKCRLRRRLIRAKQQQSNVEIHRGIVVEYFTNLVLLDLCYWFSNCDFISLPMMVGCPVVKANESHSVASMAGHILQTSIALSDKGNVDDIANTPSLSFVQHELSTSLDRRYGCSRVLGDISNTVTNLNSKFCSVGVFFFLSYYRFDFNYVVI